MFFPWSTTVMLAFESNVVVCLRLAKIGRGGDQARDESQLMMSEKASAAWEVATALLTGITAEGIIDLYRTHVSANDTRLRLTPGTTGA